MLNEVSAIILAAGSSRRMGDVNKLLLDVDGESLVRIVASRIAAAKPLEVIVVTGEFSENIQHALTGVDVKFVNNADHLKGMTSSIQAGVRVAKGRGYMICLADMYAITSEEYSKLIDTFSTDPASICLPSFAGRTGNPVVFSSDLRNEILAHQEPEGCRGFVSANRHLVRFCEMQSSNILKDIDTPEDYAEVRR